MLKKLFLLMANLQQEFIQAKTIKRPFVGISDETQQHFNPSNEIIKPMVCFKISRHER
jgi:hypothetical protein